MIEVSRNTLKDLEEKELFLELVHQAFYNASVEFGLAPHFNKALAQDAYLQWMQDVERIRQFEHKVSEPDHIKKCAHLIYWLRRFSPVNDFACMGFEGPSDQTSEQIEFMAQYGREYLAFNYGYQIARHYELTLPGRTVDQEAFSLQSQFDDVGDHDLLRTVVHIMKTKMLSPQAFVVTLKAIFLRP